MLKEKSHGSSVVPYIAEEILTAVLLFVPVKSLLRFTAVCKLWKSIIKNPYFISKHLQSQKSAPIYLFSNNTKEELVLAPFPDGVNRELSEPSILKYPECYEVDEGDEELFALHGSSNGLLCFSMERNKYPIVIWNPATKSLLKIPTPSIKSIDACELPCEEGSNIAFSFIRGKINEYKIVRLTQDYYDRNRLVAEVYSSRTGSWKELGTAVRHQYNKVYIRLFTPTVLNGIIYWLIIFHGSKNIMILSFDMASERFQEIKLPDGWHDCSEECAEHYCTELYEKTWFTSSIEGSLVLGNFDDDCLDIWESDFSRTEIWVRRYSVSWGDSGFPVGGRHSSVKALFFDGNPNRIFPRSLVYDMAVDLGTYRKDTLMPRFVNHVLRGSYVESLVPAGLDY